MTDDLAPVRVLVTGSRTWRDAPLVWDVLASFRRVMIRPGRTMLVVHGKAGGVDTMADNWADQQGIPREGHEYFGHLGRTGGYARNAHMVGLGASVCLAFIHDRSDGATGCARLAHAAGITTWAWRNVCPCEARPGPCGPRCRHRWGQEAATVTNPLQPALWD